jgi:hypothetical protein
MRDDLGLWLRITLACVVCDLSWGGCSSLSSITMRRRLARCLGIRRSGRLTVRFAAAPEFEHMEVEKVVVVLLARRVFGHK